MSISLCIHWRVSIHSRKTKPPRYPGVVHGEWKSRLFPSLRKWVWDYIEERQAIADPFTHISYPSRPNPLPFAKQPKATPVKKRTVVTKHNIDKLSQSRKVNVGYYPPEFKWNWVGQATFPTQSKAAEAAAQALMVERPTQKSVACFSFMQQATATVPAMPTKPSVTISDQKSLNYCVTCTPLGKQCPTTYPMPLNPNWSDSK